MIGLQLEVGNAYREASTGKLHLAMSAEMMITYHQQTLIEVRVKSGFEVKRTLSVGLLLEEWKIPVTELDRVTYLYLAPNIHRNVGVRQRRTTRRGDSDEELEIFQGLRLHRTFGLSL